jgi:hypothetical protein
MTDSNMLSLAVTRFLGYGMAAYPDENPARLIEEFGAQAASKLESDVRLLLDELNNLKPDWSMHSLVTAGAWAKDNMRCSHPELNQEALDALEWAFTWWWR